MISISLGILNIIVAFFFLTETKNCSLDNVGKKAAKAEEPAQGTEMATLLNKEPPTEEVK